jgi:hypothetical protein
MRYRLRTFEPVADTDQWGDEAPKGFVERATIHAERVKFSGNRSEEVGEHFPDYRVEFNIRDAHPVEENWRVKQLGGYEYTVTNIIPNIDRGMKTLVCERVNK